MITVVSETKNILELTRLSVPPPKTLKKNTVNESVTCIRFIESIVQKGVPPESTTFLSDSVKSQCGQMGVNVK